MKRLLVLGAGESGVGTALLAQSKGYEVFVSDFGIIQKTYKDVLSGVLFRNLVRPLTSVAHDNNFKD